MSHAFGANKHRRKTSSSLKMFFILMLMSCFFIKEATNSSSSSSSLEHEIVEIGDNFTDLLNGRSDKKWLIKFYTRSCQHCQRIESVFSHLAKKIYRNHTDIIVGQIDCNEHGEICKDYLIEALPTMIYLTQESGTIYKGDWSERSLMEFFERFHGPDVKTIEVDDCNHNQQPLRRAVNRHGFIVLSTFTAADNNGGDADSELLSSIYRRFKAVAKSLKSSHWFFKLNSTVNSSSPCSKTNNNANKIIPNHRSLITENNLYIFKKDLKKPLKYMIEPKEIDERQRTAQEEDLWIKKMTNWIVGESFPVYGIITRNNLERLLSIKRTLFVYIKPTRLSWKKHNENLRQKEQLSSKKTTSTRLEEEHLSKVVQEFAIERANQDDDDLDSRYIFAWSKDVSLMQSMSAIELEPPSIMIIRADKSYYLHNIKLNTNLKYPDQQEEQVKVTLAWIYNDAQRNNLEFKGGDSYLSEFYTTWWNQYREFKKTCQTNPIAATTTLVVLLFLYNSKSIFTYLFKLYYIYHHLLHPFRWWMKNSSFDNKRAGSKKIKSS